MKYYTYKLTLKQDPRYYYYGVHKTQKEDPNNDGYFGSGNGVAELKLLYGSDCFSKEVLTIWPDRKSSLQEEARLVGDLWKTDPFCINRMPGGAFRAQFDVTGLIAIHRGSNMKYINPNLLSEFEAQGWSKGMPESRAFALRHYVSIHRGDQEKRIFPEDLPSYEKEGWQKGRSKKYLLELKRRIHITDGIHSKSVQPELLQTYLDQGWYKGHSKTHVENSAKAQTNMIWMSRGQEITRVPPEKFEEFQQSGWAKGNSRLRGRQKTEKERQRSRETQIGRIWINNGKRSKKIYPEEEQTYLNQGWKKGRRKGDVINTGGTIKIYKPGTKEFSICWPDQLETKLSGGWVVGRGW